jgi:hypothetical protein
MRKEIRDTYLSFSKKERPYRIEQRTKSQLNILFRSEDPGFFETVYYEDGVLYPVKVGASGIKDLDSKEDKPLDESYPFYKEMKKYLKKHGLPLINPSGK